MEFLKIVIMGVVAACLYGVVQDQVTVRVCIEYFTVGHPPVFRTQSPTMLALGWGVIATWWVGLPLGLLIGLFSRYRPPRLVWRDLVRPLLLVLCLMAMLSLLAGVAGLMAAWAGEARLLEPLASQVPAGRHDLFLADLWAHNTAYLSGLLGGIGLCVWCVLARRRRRATSASPC